MRLGTRHRIHISTHGRRKISGFLVFMLIVTLLTGSLIYFLKIIRPVMMELSKNQATMIAEQAMHRAIGRLFADTDYSEIVDLSRLEDGTISAVTSNMSRVNQLKAEASMSITEEIAKVDEIELFLPMGTLMGYDLFASIGPRFSVQLMPYGHVVVEFETSFTETGINQTLLTVNLTATTQIGIVLPSVNMTTKVTTTMPVTQTVIVGKIPDNYVHIGELGENYESDVLDIIG